MLLKPGVFKADFLAPETELLRDDIYAFFIFCYHFKDWIINDNSINIIDKYKTVEKFIKSNTCLKYCYDICHGIKHLKLTAQRSKKRPALRKIEKNIFWRGSKPSWFANINVYLTTDTGEIDVYELASTCVKAWVSFIREHIDKSFAVS